MAKSVPKKKASPSGKAVKSARGSVKAAPKKAAPARQPAKKISMPKKPVSKSVKPLSKAPAKAAKPAPKAVVKAKPAPTKAPAPKPVAAKAAPAKPAKAVKAAPAKAVVEAPRVLKSPYNADFLGKQKQRLIDLRDHLVNQMQGVAQDTLRVRAEGSEASAFGMHQADAGSDAYDKDFALSLLSQEQDALYEIEEALKRVETNAYGTCEMSSKPIPKVRLEAIPHARFTVECQAQLERENKGRRRWDTIPQFMDSAETLVDEEEESSDEDDRRKEKE
jgi:DnaK suppressor protein